jgi:hypothetical protein
MKLGGLLSFIIVAVSLVLTVGTSPATAISGADWKAGRIMDDSVFYNSFSMNAAHIQQFLNAKNPSCDRWGTEPSEFGGGTRAQYGTAHGNPPPYTCLKNYYENTTTKENNLEGRPIPAGAKSAAQIIWDAAQLYDINPQVLITLIQKEQTLVTDEWPFPRQFRSATGYGCPDSSGCNSLYYGFYNQVRNAARQFRLYANNPNNFNHVPRQNNFIRWSPNTSCGGSTVFIENQATASLYNYTPYQPNAAALNNLRGTGDGCSAYGNRNFWRIFHDWFGSTWGKPYAWAQVSKTIYTDSTKQKSIKENQVKRGQLLYVQIKALNTGNATWRKGVKYEQVSVGTSNPIDRRSRFCTADWMTSACNRAAPMLENEVKAGEVGTFEFWLNAPLQPGVYKEYFNLVIDGTAWLSDIGFYWQFTVGDRFAEEDYPRNYLSTTTRSELRRNQYITSPDGNTTAVLKKEGFLQVYRNFKPTWRAGSQAVSLKLRSDGNLVLLRADGQIAWQSNTNSGKKLHIQNDGNLVLYDINNQAVWASNSAVNATVTWRLQPHDIAHRGQFIKSQNRKYALALQRDGNLVLYSPSRALWATNTRDGFLLVQQNDGNMVLYNVYGRPVWASRTAGTNATTYLQNDGNLVTYSVNGKALWATNTAGQ